MQPRETALRHRVAVDVEEISHLKHISYLVWQLSDDLAPAMPNNKIA
jgi:hypothetical protein